MGKWVLSGYACRDKVIRIGSMSRFKVLAGETGDGELRLESELRRHQHKICKVLN